MKIKQKVLSYEEVLNLPKEPHLKPLRPSKAARLLLKTVSAGELKKVGFTLETDGMEKLGQEEPALFLMNHSSFIDLKIASAILYPRPFNIVCTSDGFVGKSGLMRWIGCIPTKKFVTDTTLVRDMVHAVKKLNSSILMYPEASYSFDGTATPLPDSLGKCAKMLGVPVVMIRTYGAFARDPLYNNLQIRDVKVKAKMEYLLSPEDIKAKSAEEITEIIKSRFDFDNFRWQRENGIKVSEPFRADYINRVLYKCPCCGKEGATIGKGASLTCKACGTEWHLNEFGALEQQGDGKQRFDHIPDWYAWERAEVRKELEEGSYKLDIPVRIAMLVDTKSIYFVGEGRLVHDNNGFTLTGCDGKLSTAIPASSSYSLYSDYYWYEIGDVICISDGKTLYYCFPQNGGDIVAKTRLAAEELYKLKKQDQNR